jgi:hypothetical protein
MTNNVVELNIKEAHKFVEQNFKKGFFWDGWTIVKWSPGHNGYLKTNGMYRNNKWGYANKYFLTNKGTWLIPTKYVTNT